MYKHLSRAFEITAGQLKDSVLPNLLNELPYQIFWKDKLTQQYSEKGKKSIPKPIA